MLKGLYTCNFMLNDKQMLVVNENPEKNLCIIACAGSGKTTTILHRI